MYYDTTNACRLVSAIQTGHSKLLRCVLDLVSMLSVESPFISGKAKEFLASCENMMTKVKPFSDLFVYLYLFQSFSGMSSRSDQRALIAKYFLHEKVCVIFVSFLESERSHSIEIPIEDHNFPLICPSRAS